LADTPTTEAKGLGSAARPLTVAIVGSGPAGFYAAEHLLRQSLSVRVDLLERLPVPFGLVRFGVAPDHQRIKQAARAFERTAQHPGFRFFGNVDVGRDVTHAELLEHYDQVLYSVGSAADRRLGIPGEDLAGSHSATSFVGWYNGHPDFRCDPFDLGCERAIVVGMGNVALDVARVLVRDPEELGETDITSYALQALRESRVREVVVLGRRGPAQAAFDLSELQDIVGLKGVSVRVRREEIAPALDLPDLDSTKRKLVEFLMQLAETAPPASERRVSLRFCVSPVEVLGKDGRVDAVRLEQNDLERASDGSTRARPSGRFDVEPAGLIFRSIGYRGIALPGLPFDERNGIIPNAGGRVTDGPNGPVCERVYVAGWIKRGPTGLIGTNKADAKDTVAKMLEDLPALDPNRAAPGIEATLQRRGVRAVSFAEWQILDELERRAGQRSGKLREKFCSVADMLGALADALPKASAKG